MNRRYWLMIAIIVVASLLTAAGLYMRDAGVGADDDGSSTPAASDTPGNAGGVEPSDEASEPVSSAEETVTIGDEPAKEGDQVPDAVAYELIDALKASGIEPAMGEALTLEFVERLNRVRVSGRFESSEATSFVLGYAGGMWKVEK